MNHQFLKENMTLQADGYTYTIHEVIGYGATTTAYRATSQFGRVTTECILKEYNPSFVTGRTEEGACRFDDAEKFEKGKAAFLFTANRQNNIRQISELKNLTPPVSHIFEAGNTAYASIVGYRGNTLDKIADLSFLEYMELFLTVAKTVNYYHKAGYLCLDIKPENIFVLQNTEEDTITQLVEFIDFDSIRDVEKDQGKGLSYTRDWAAPEQKNHVRLDQIGMTADIYTLGEMVFYYIFGRHSQKEEQRSSATYPFDYCLPAFRKILARNAVQNILIHLFQHTLRSSAMNRYKTAKEVVFDLEKLVEEVRKRDYVIPMMPAVSPAFLGRTQELQDMASHLAENSVLFLYGIGGIGKSTLAKNYALANKTKYDAIIYLEYDGDIRRTFADDTQLLLSTCRRQGDEDVSAYFDRKIMALQNICAEQKVLLIIDNFSGPITKEVSRLTKLGYDTLMVSRQQPPLNSFPFMEIGAIQDIEALFRLICVNLQRPMSKDEQVAFTEIIDMIQGHTLVLELIARQISAGNIDSKTAVAIIRENGFTQLSDRKIRNYKDNEEVYDRLSAIVSALFQAEGLSDAGKATMKILAMMDVRGLEREFLEKIVALQDMDIVQRLAAEGWIYVGKRIRVHPVIAETVSAWLWPTGLSQKQVMDYHQRMTAIYECFCNAERIHKILEMAETYLQDDSSAYAKGIYYNIMAGYYDAVLAGANFPVNDEEEQLYEQQLDAIQRSIAYMHDADEEGAIDRQISYMLGLANVLTNAYPGRHAEARDILEAAGLLLQQDKQLYAENRCYYYMSMARYYTIAQPNLEKTMQYQSLAADIAAHVFPTELERVEIIYIPAANNYFFHYEYDMAEAALWQAITLCQNYPDVLPYVDKRIELMRCLLDVYMEAGDVTAARGMLHDIDALNEKYKDDGIFRGVDPDIRKELQEL